MQPPNFNSVPLLGQQRQQAVAHLNAAIGQLAMQIYSQVAISHVVRRDEHQELEPEVLRTAAKDAITAAKCYFEGIGALKPEGAE